MYFLTLLLTSLFAGTDTLNVTKPENTLDLTGTVIVNADYANQPVSSVTRSEASAVDTLDTHDEFVKILLYGDRTWRYIKLKGYEQKPALWEKRHGQRKRPLPEDPAGETEKAGKSLCKSRPVFPLQ